MLRFGDFGINEKNRESKVHSKLFHIGPLEVHSYGLMLSISFLVGSYFSMCRIKKHGIDNNKVIDLSIVIVISAILGAGLIYYNQKKSKSSVPKEKKQPIQ